MFNTPILTSLEIDCNLSTCDTSDDGDTTMRQSHSVPVTSQADNQCCLVQIYPADVVSGMLLLEADRVVAGRDISADLLLEDTSVSRQHAELIRQGNGYLIRDLGSTNGTLVNGGRMMEHTLRSGDTIKLGSFIFKFLSAGSVETKYHETVYSAMTRDALSGAMNKRYLLESLPREVARAVRQRQALSVLMLDIDHFKSVNDNHGHLVGDEVIREFGTRMLSGCREDDLLARYGGEEFCLVLCSTDREAALQIAERNREVISGTPFTTNAGPLSITVSFGVSCLNPSTPETVEDLLRRADAKLYEAKRSGRNCVAS